MRQLLLLFMITFAYARFTPDLPKEREKRFIDFGAAWKTLIKDFPPTIRDVQRNAEVRMEAEAKKINPIEYSHPVHTEPYQTNFDNSKVLYMSMSKSPMKPVPMKSATADVYVEPAVPLKGGVSVQSVQQTPPAGFVQDDYQTRTVHKRSPEVQVFNPSQRSSILGKGARSTVTHFAKVTGAQTKTASLEAPAQKEDLHAKISKRSAQESKAPLALDDPNLAEKIIAESTTAEEALAKMLDAERKIDTVLHQVIGDVHVSDDKDIDTIEEMLDSAAKKISKRSAEDEVVQIVKQSAESVASAGAIIEEGKENSEEKALQEIIKADKDFSAILEMILPREEIEKSAKERTKREHSVDYYDPEFQWLVNNLRLDQAEGSQIRDIVYGESSISQPQIYRPNFYTGSPDYASYTHGSQPAINPYRPELYYNERQNKMEDKSTFHKLLDSLRPIADAVPYEVDAAYQGALEVGKHFTKQVRPYVSQGYHKVANEFIPKATETISDSIGEDVKNFARQGRKIVESRARYASKVANPHLESIKDDLWLLQEQLKQVAEETSEYTKTEIVPNIGPTLQGLIFDVQETLELANQMIETDVVPLVKKVASSVSPAASTVNDYVVKPVTEGVSSYVVDPVSSYVVNPVASYVSQPVASYVVDPVNSYVVDPVNSYVVNPVVQNAGPLYQTAQSYASSGVDTAKVTYQKVKPTIQQFSDSTQKVFTEDVAPRVKVAASQVADGASRLGETIQSDVVPHVQQGVSTTLHGLFTGIPSLVKQVSHGANDAAKIFSNRYQQALEQIRSKAELKRKEEEAKLNMVHKQMQEMDINHNTMDVKNMMDKGMMDSHKKTMDMDNIVMVDEKAKKYDAIVKAIVEEEKALMREEATETPQTKSKTSTPSLDELQTTTPKEL